MVALVRKILPIYFLHLTDVLRETIGADTRRAVNEPLSVVYLSKLFSPGTFLLIVS